MTTTIRPLLSSQSIDDDDHVDDDNRDSLVKEGDPNHSLSVSIDDDDAVGDEVRGKDDDYAKTVQ